MSKGLASVALASVLLSSVACLRAENQTPVTNNITSRVKLKPSISARAIIAEQPDFVAEEFYSSFERLHGHSFVNKVAKKGEYYRREGPVMVFFDKAGEPTLWYRRPAKMFVDDPPPKQPPLWYESANNAEVFARTEGVRFEVVGAEELEGNECVKIKATAEDAVQIEGNGATVFLYAAKNLRNLVVATELALPDRKTTYILRNISFDVPDELFEVLARRPRQTPRVSESTASLR